jgi:hypothetical protein
VPVDAILGRFGGRGRSSVAGAAGAAACSDAEFEKEEIEMVAGLLGRQAGLGLGSGDERRELYFMYTA